MEIKTNFGEKAPNAHSHNCPVFAYTMTLRQNMPYPHMFCKRCSNRCGNRLNNKYSNRLNSKCSNRLNNKYGNRLNNKCKR